ncbi:MAG: hypothetical protein RLZZ15_1164 [Verrucomicrobiota bacterium]
MRAVGRAAGAPAAALAARINGLFPWPACAVELRGQPLKLGLAEALPPSSADARAELFAPAAPSTNATRAAPGEILGADVEALLVATGAGTLRVLRLQRPGGKMLAAPEFLRGFPLERGLRSMSRPMRALVASEPFRAPRPAPAANLSPAQPVAPSAAPRDATS